jgi:hypothetical protein
MSIFIYQNLKKFQEKLQIHVLNEGLRVLRYYIGIYCSPIVRPTLAH